jgi:hypothetical protein
MPNAFCFKRYAAVILLVCFAQAPIAHSGPIAIDLQPDPTYAGTGDSISFDLIISGLGDFTADTLGTFDISVGFDTSALSFSSYSLGGLLGDVSLVEALDASSGVLGGIVNVAEVSLLSGLALDALQPDLFTLATLNFNVINLAEGVTTQLSVLQGAVLGDVSGGSLAVTEFGSASVEAIPVPGTLLLLIASLGGWLMFTNVALTRRRPVVI